MALVMETLVDGVGVQPVEHTPRQPVPVAPQAETPPQAAVETAPNEAAVPASADTPTGEEGSDADKPKGDGGWQRRINRLTEQKYALLGDVERLQAENARLRAQPQ